jgi:hypothetical protein
VLGCRVAVVYDCYDGGQAFGLGGILLDVVGYTTALQSLSFVRIKYPSIMVLPILSLVHSSCSKIVKG